MVKNKYQQTQGREQYVLIVKSAHTLFHKKKVSHRINNAINTQTQKAHYVPVFCFNSTQQVITISFPHKDVQVT